LSEPVEWLIAEWPKGEKKPTKFWLSTLPADCTLQRMIDITMMRWRIEPDYLELKQEVGLGLFEGRGWRGFHHHATMCIAAYGFLVSERSAFPPCRRPALLRAKPALPEGYRSRGSPTRPERHVPSSIARVRRYLDAGLVDRPPRCPCCARASTAISPTPT
jgi:hypothetical protein